MPKRRQPGDLVQLRVRVREDLRGRLEAEARAGQTSINALVADRLERSFEKATALQEAVELALTSAYGPQGDVLLRMLGRAQRDACVSLRLTPEDQWADDDAAAAHVAHEMILLIRVLLGEPREVPGTRLQTYRELLGIAVEEYVSMSPRRHRLRQRLGDRVLERVRYWWKGEQAKHDEALHDDAREAAGRTEPDDLRNHTDKRKESEQ